MSEAQMIRIELTPDDIQKRGQSIARLMGEIAQRKQALKDSCKEEREEIRALENQAWALATEVREKARYEPAQMKLVSARG